MAGIKVLQHDIFKINSSKMRYYNWDLHITKEEAKKSEEMIPLFQSQCFRSIAKILNADPSSVDYTKYICALEVDTKADFKKATKGFAINDIRFKRFVGTTGGLKNNTVLFVNEEIYDELYTISECGRDTSKLFIPAKLEAYRALFCSASQEIVSPNGILVVSDCITEYFDDIIKLDDSGVETEPKMKILKNQKLENTVSDGFNLCTIEYMEKVKDKLGIDYTPSGVCLRNAWVKGMLYPFPIVEFFERFRPNNYIVQDIWGNDVDIREVEMILTESSLKLWDGYKSIEHYVDCYKSYGFEFAVTKIAPKKLEDCREVNYQYLQSYDFDENDIATLCDPTVNFLKDSMCGDYESTIEFLGINGNLNDNSWQQALYTNRYMLNDPYVIDSVHRMIKKKINDAKIGKLRISGNYQIASGDPFLLMQHICGLDKTGLLSANECYSKYWNDNGVEEVCIFRSPMTCHNNIRKCKVKNTYDCNFWYKYMDTIMIINGWDSFMASENGCDWDGDILYSTDNKVLLSKHKQMKPIFCIQRNTQKLVPTEEDIIQSNMNGMGNKVGQITNRVTNMMEVQSRFEKGSKEWEEMAYRIACGQLYQQNELDKIKGVDFKPMPKHWYNASYCDTDYQLSLCANKKPYFFLYNYDYLKKEYNAYVKASESKCIIRFRKTIQELYDKEDKTEEELDFLAWYEKGLNVGFGSCSMNKICDYVEQQFAGYKKQIKEKGEFDYNKLKVNRRCTEKHRQQLKELCDDYVCMVAEYKRDRARLNESKSSNTVFAINKRREYIKIFFRSKAKEICPNDDERLNIVLDMCYGCKNNRQFCWDCIGDLIVKRLEEMNDD